MGTQITHIPTVFVFLTMRTRTTRRTLTRRTGMTMTRMTRRTLTRRTRMTRRTRITRRTLTRRTGMTMTRRILTRRTGMTRRTLMDIDIRNNMCLSYYCSCSLVSEGGHVKELYDALMAIDRHLTKVIGNIEQ